MCVGVYYHQGTGVFQVMADYLRLFVKYVLARLEEMYGAVDANPDNIQWCGTAVLLGPWMPAAVEMHQCMIIYGRWLVRPGMHSCRDAAAGFRCLEAWLSACCYPGA